MKYNKLPARRARHGAAAIARYAIAARRQVAVPAATAVLRPQQ